MRRKTPQSRDEDLVIIKGARTKTEHGAHLLVRIDREVPDRRTTVQSELSKKDASLVV